MIVGDASGGGNVISGNLDMGIDVVDASQSGAKLGVLTVQGNRIGLASDGMTAVPNASGGIRVNGQFGTVTVVAGAGVGLALGMLVVKLIGGFFPAGLPVSNFGILISAGFAVGVGLFAGLYPSLSAARLEPIEALRA
ncbi:MAG: ABC transporter permease [Thermoanaerobaculia bacterium]